jgi:hypothetical protein
MKTKMEEATWKYLSGWCNNVANGSYKAGRGCGFDKQAVVVWLCGFDKQAVAVTPTFDKQAAAQEHNQLQIRHKSR